MKNFDVKVDSEYTLTSGIKKIYNNNYDLILLDLNLPDSRGYSTYKSVQQITDTPILVITGESAETFELYGVNQDYAIAKIDLCRDLLDEKMKILLHNLTLKRQTKSLLDEVNKLSTHIDRKNTYRIHVNSV